MTDREPLAFGLIWLREAAGLLALLVVVVAVLHADLLFLPAEPAPVLTAPSGAEGPGLLLGEAGK